MRMWCANCQADVAAEVTADNRRIHCATCGMVLNEPEGSRSTAKTREARELLERWSNDKILDPATALPPVGASPSPRPIDNVGISNNTGISNQNETSQPKPTPSKPIFRIDSPHSPDQPSVQAPPPERVTPASPPDQSTLANDTLRMHAPHAGTPAPHIQQSWKTLFGSQRTSNWSSLLGQILAYGGVALLTIGSAFVLWGYFGENPEYAPTGWLITTVGQMLLFLGVVTLVSGGMEQTTEEVARRIDTLGDKILRIEQASRDHALRGPSIPAERFADATSNAASANSPTHADLNPPS